MTVVLSGPGKTAPKLFHDFLYFDPQQTAPRANYLTDITPPIGEGNQLAPPSRACKHEYVTKKTQSVLPPLDFRPSDGGEYLVSVICRKCRIHAAVHAFPPPGERPCPNVDFPLHHYQRHVAGDSTGYNRIVNAWQCSSHQCRAQVQVVYRIQRLSEQDRHLLTNTDYLRRRYEAVLADDPKREGIKQATPLDAVSRLRKYISDSMNPAHTRRSFPANNKRFMEAFGIEGKDCSELLHRIGFKYKDREWSLPVVSPIDDRLHVDEHSDLEALEDVEVELQALQDKLAAEAGTGSSTSHDWTSARQDIERCFAAQGYDRQLLGRRHDHDTELVPYFFSLGALPDFSDSLVVFAHDRQTKCDPANSAYHFECLQAITDARGTEQLQMEVATLASQDTVSRRDLLNACRILHIDQPETISNEKIIDKYQALLSDAGTQTQEDARQALQKIGIARGSPLLINAARQELETYEDALIWLGNGVDKDTPDEALLAVVALKTDNPANDETATKAISIISKARKSNQLNNWLATGQMGGYTMSADEAARYLGIEQDIATVDRSILTAIFDVARTDRPGDTTEKAIAVIQQAIMSEPANGSHPPGTWPVGLTSHGNTCYLNSLLQYYFAIKPLRNIVLNYDRYRFDTGRVQKKTHRVGRLVSMTEIKGGQRFAADLKHLFERMTTDPGEHVKPEEDLVCRAFLKAEDYALLGESSKESDSSAVDQTTIMDSAIEEVVSNDDHALGIPATSSTTPQASADDHQPSQSLKDAALPPTPPASPGTKASVMPVAPSAAPPLPPRRFSMSTKEEALRLAESKARQQQDVAEVHDEIMFRLRSGMRPKNVAQIDTADEASPNTKPEVCEQEDELRDLFLIGLRETTVKDGVDGEQISLSETDIQTAVPEAETDVYAALDQVFDLQAVGDKFTKYRSITSPPPLLQINTPRIGFDRKKLTNYKSDVCMRLYDELFLDRYCDEVDGQTILPKRRRCWAWQKELLELQKEAAYLRKTPTKDVTLPEQISEVAKYLATITASAPSDDSITLTPTSELQQALEADAESQAQRLVAIDAQIVSLQDQLSNEFVDAQKLKYRLAAVFFHRGGTNSGHYWVYIHDFQNNVWRRYNDERVEEFTQLDEIYEARHYNHGTPTYAVYVRDDLKTELVEPVHRTVAVSSDHEETIVGGDTTVDSPLIDMDDIVMVDGDEARNHAAEQTQTSSDGVQKSEVETSGAWDEVRTVPDQTKW